MKRSVLIFVAVSLFSASVAVSLQAQRGAGAAPAAQGAPAATARTYVGSQACRQCHAATYERWSKTRMANVVTDPKAHPEMVLPDFSKPDPALTFSQDDVAFVYGTKWKQRYFKKVGD